MGKPTLYTPELWKSLLDWIEEGHPLADWCRADDSRPRPRTIREWAAADEEMGSQYSAAFDAGMDAIAHRARKTIRGKGEDQGGESTDDVMRDKAIAELDVKLLSKWSARYRDKVQQEITGKDGGAVEHSVTHRLPAAAQGLLDRISGRGEAGCAEVPRPD